MSARMTLNAAETLTMCREKAVKTSPGSPTAMGTKSPSSFGDNDAANSLLKMAIVNMSQVTPPSGAANEDEKLEDASKPIQGSPPTKRKRFTYTNLNGSKNRKQQKICGSQVETKLEEMISRIERVGPSQMYACQPAKKLSVFSRQKSPQNQGKIPLKDKVNGGNWQCWSHEEEVFLVGAVLERFFSRGSLSSTKKENHSSKHNCWETIKETYDSSWRRYSAARGMKCPPERSENALSRHYKVMKERSIAKNHRSNVDFKSFYDEWENNYNKKFGLLPQVTYDDPGNAHTDDHHRSRGPGPLHPLTPTKGNQSQSRGRWNYRDEVILIGVVLETFFQRGSLSSSHKERLKTENDFWQNLHSMFERVKQEYNREHGLEYTKMSRTAQALARHFKVMKVKLIESQGRLNLKTYYREWENTYRRFYQRIENHDRAVEGSFSFGMPRHNHNHLNGMNFAPMQFSPNGHPLANPMNQMRALKEAQFKRGIKNESTGDQAPMGLSKFGYNSLALGSNPFTLMNGISQTTPNPQTPTSTANAAAMLANLSNITSQIPNDRLKAGVPQPSPRMISNNGVSTNVNSPKVTGNGAPDGKSLLAAGRNSIFNQSLLNLSFINGLNSPMTPGFSNLPTLSSFPNSPMSTGNTTTSGGTPNCVSTSTNKVTTPMQPNTCNGSGSTPVSALDLNKINDLLTPIAGTTPVQGIQTPQTPMFPQMMSPQPIVTTSGNATTYWLPLTLYKMDENNNNTNKENGNSPNGNRNPTTIKGSNGVNAVETKHIDNRSAGCSTDADTNSLSELPATNQEVV